MKKIKFLCCLCGSCSCHDCNHVHLLLVAREKNGSGKNKSNKAFFSEVFHIFFLLVHVNREAMKIIRGLKLCVVKSGHYAEAAACYAWSMQENEEEVFENTAFFVKPESDQRCNSTTMTTTTMMMVMMSRRTQGKYVF